MVGGTGMAGESFHDAASGTQHGVGSPQAGRRSAVAAEVERATSRARLWFALVVLAALLVLGLIVVL